MSGLAVLCLLLLQTGALGFKTFNSSPSLNHRQITERAILSTTAEVCRSLALAEGKDFTLPSGLTAQSVAVACEAPKSSKSFREGKSSQMDYVLSNSATRQNTFGCQYFYLDISYTLYSNWVELGNKLPNSNLIREGTNIGNIDKNRSTCRNCDGDNCRNNILEDILRENILTSGYFDFLPFKPSGKCSHGDTLDTTSLFEPTGGINKDTLKSKHGHLHREAANLAIAATSELLEDIRGAAGDEGFLQMMGISRRSGKALCFVIDTTGSMSDDIAAVREVTAFIINSKVGTEEEPSVYILVPFNDPDFGPLIRTRDPQVFKDAINSLSAHGGGDFPEFSLSGLQLALTGAPSNSEIFLFTDAPAKDEYLKSTVLALIEKTQSVVNFMITASLGFRRKRESGDNQQQQLQSRMVSSAAQLYRDLAQASGGQAIEVTKSELLEATSIITESSSSSLVTLLQAARNPGKVENFTLTVDESVRNLTVYITGSSVNFILISPSGVPQQSTNSTGLLITAFQSVGNFKTLKLKTEAGQWQIKMLSTNPYTLKVVGESPIDFLFYFVEVLQSGGFNFLENRPRAGANGSLIVTVTGSDSATVTEVLLVESSGSGEVNGTVEAQGEGDYLAQFDRIPSAEFFVLVKGQNNDGSSKASTLTFQRQSPTHIRGSSLTVTVDDSDGVLVPGTPLSVPFTVKDVGAGGNFSIRATNDQGFNSTFPSSLSLGSGGSANGTVTLTAPLNTTSGTGVTLTIEAEAPGGADINYIVLRFTVLETVTDFLQPKCELLSLQSNCSGDCTLSMWELSVQVTDGAEGTGIDRISLRQGNGTINSSLASGNENITLVSYNASCCSPDVQLLVVDRVGNVGSCFYSIRKSVNVTTTTNSPQPPTTATAASASLSTSEVQSFVLCLSITILGLN